MDPLSEVFSLLDMQSAATSRLEAGGRWALQFPAKSHLKFHAVLRGRCWITISGEQPCLLETGDTFLLANAPAFILASDLGEAPQDAASVLFKEETGVFRHNGDETALLGGGFVFRSENAQLLLDALSVFIRIPATHPEAAILHSTLELLDNELANPRMGSSLMARRLGDILLVQALRAHVASQGADGARWVGALSDERIGAALTLMHRDVGRSWNLTDLAGAVGMSRSGFAGRFKDLVGVPPLDYLLHWRMQLARDALRHNGISVAKLALKLGYSSESAFGNAFKRVFGRAPKRYWTKA